MSEQLMICPKWKECTKRTCTIAYEPHLHRGGCVRDANCPACIPYEPEPQECKWQLVKLPPIETIKEIFALDPDWIANFTAIHAVYSTAQPVDIKKLAEKLYWLDLYASQERFEQAINEYLEGK